MIIDEAPGIAAGKQCWCDCTVPLSGEESSIITKHSRSWTTNQNPNDYQQRAGIAAGKQCWWDCTVLPELGRAIISVYDYKAQ